MGLKPKLRKRIADNSVNPGRKTKVERKEIEKRAIKPY
jgi:hypothetical protein